MWCWIHPEKQRYYQADLVVDLFGDWTMVCAWGGLGSKRGRQRITGVASQADGMEKITELDAHRQKRGYLPVESFANWRLQVAAARGNTPPPITQQVKKRGNGLSQELDFG